MARTGPGRRRTTQGESILTILSVAYPFAPVSLRAAGGAEQILALLDRGIHAAGQESIVIACQGSRVEGELIAIPAPQGTIDGPARLLTHALWRAAIHRVLQTRRVDLVHAHGIDFFEYLPPDGIPLLATLHLPPSWYPREVFETARPRTWLNCVSQAQRQSCPPSPLLTTVIENGVPLDLLAAPAAPKGDYVLALGRICPEKGFHLALNAAQQADVPLYLAGKLFHYPDHVRYWQQELRPRLRPPHRFFDSPSLRKKSLLLARARCLLAPSLAPETSSLVAMEALACGTPVVAFPSGALPEVVDHGRTGFLVTTVAGMAAAIGAAPEIDPEHCRRVAAQRFSSARMITQYLELYSRILRLDAPNPIEGSCSNGPHLIAT